MKVYPSLKSIQCTVSRRTAFAVIKLLKYRCAYIRDHVCRTHRSCWRQAWVVVIAAAKKCLALCLPFSSVTGDVTLTLSLPFELKPNPITTDTAEESLVPSHGVRSHTELCIPVMQFLSVDL